MRNISSANEVIARGMDLYREIKMQTDKSISLFFLHVLYVLWKVLYGGSLAVVIAPLGVCMYGG